MRRKASPWQRNLGYPLAMLVLLALTVHTHSITDKHFVITLIDFIKPIDCFHCNIAAPQVMCVLMVCFNVLELLLDETAMPRGMEVRILQEQICEHFVLEGLVCADL